jgi:Cu(I)/Ag(I) efflux system membrane fusion protein
MEKLSVSAVLRQAQTAIKKYWYAPGVLILLAVLFLVGSWYGQRNAAGPNAAGSRRILYYVDPMNPAHTSPEPGFAPCGMKLEPVYADNEAQAAGPALPPGSVKITPEKQQIIGVRVATVEKSPFTYTLRTVGKVDVDETRLYRLKALTEGWIVKVYNNATTGSLVRKDEPLATFYIRDLPTNLQTFFYAIDAVDRMKNDPNLAPGQQDLLEAQRLSAEGVLINLGMSRMQIKDLIRTRQLVQEIIISAPATSFVLARNVTAGQKFNSGEELYRLADLSRVWILADLFKNEAKYIRPGEKVKVTLPDQDEMQMATVSEVLPQFDPATLTLKVRLEMDNPKFALRPGMFMDVEFPINLPPTVNVPADAIMDSGLKKTVFVDRRNGFFEPRRVKTGWRLGDRVEIIQGLEPGQRIAISGNFLIDSESRMKLAAAGFFGNVVKDPVCGMNLDEGKAKAASRKTEYQKMTYYFCSDACKQKFDQTPERYLAKTDAGPAHDHGTGSHQTQVTTEKVKDPVCGMAVLTGAAPKAGLTTEYQGKTYYFCSAACKQKFEQAPERYLAKTEAGLAHDHATGSHQPQVAAEDAKDPVCGLPVATGAAREAGRTSQYQGKTYYFDTAGCKQRFDQDPQRYLFEGSEAAKAPSVPIQSHTNVPLNPEMLLRNKRKLLQAPQGPSAAMPQERGQVMPQGPTQAGPQEQMDSNALRYYEQHKLLRAVPRGPTPAMRQRALEAMRQREVEAANQGPAQVAPQGPAPANPQGPAPAISQAPGQAAPPGAVQVVPQAPTPVAPPKPTQVKPQKPQTPYMQPQFQQPAASHGQAHQDD